VPKTTESRHAHLIGAASTQRTGLIREHRPVELGDGARSGVRATSDGVCKSRRRSKCPLARVEGGELLHAKCLR